MPSAGFLLSLGIVISIVGFDLYASFAVITAEGTPTSKKRLQLLFVWLVPIIGAILALAVHNPSAAASTASLKDVSADEGIHMPGQLSDYDQLNH
jgi:hypothetical protein